MSRPAAMRTGDGSCQTATVTRSMRWSTAMRTGLYEPGGFYARHSPSAHFRTSAQTPQFAHAIAELVRRVDTALGHPDPFSVVDMGAGSGELLHALTLIEPLDGRLAPVAVELRDRPGTLDSSIHWHCEPPAAFSGLLMACEWLDNVPCDVVEESTEGPRYQLVSPTTGETTLGESLSEADLDWLRRWWPLSQVGDQAEIGRTRDDAWQSLVSRLDAGLAIAIDYGHLLDSRPQWSTMAGYADGRSVHPIPDGNRDITAHVAMDSLGAGTLLPQREALAAVGLSASRPPLELSRTDPTGYLRRLSAIGETAELIDPAGLGGHWWLARGVGIGDEAWMR